jgi:hypothetical protein
MVSQTTVAVCYAESQEAPMVEKLKSRKFWAGLFGVVAPIALQVVTGQVGWPQAVGMSVAAAVTYIAAEAHVDAAKAKPRA